ncbi:response regulator transcription factor [Corynebacterium sp. TAE3-ERU12]|uniref:response regulator transcription factor n=1 Tax=Corynebacterium sp. TAE3-ERU12 TaxID=2849491 RepID=UPI001C4642C1|nr:response regulator transcription factor [Corynebacterium sp. TAE3-ERU12]MBV7295908.1 response regulator transcription factor [Corynebacterium sp. TAE3-ERU12]
MTRPAATPADQADSVRVLLADDSGLLRESLAAMLARRGFTVVGQCADADELPRVVEELVAAGNAPEVIITDVRMPPEMTDDGLRAAADIRAAYPQIGIVVCSQYVAAAYARRVLELSQPAGSVGGTGYVLKDNVGHVADFIRTVRAVAAGAVVIDPEVAGAMSRTAPGITGLTPRETEVLEAMSRGLANSEIAAELFISEAAVGKHIAAILMKLNLPPEIPNRRVKAILAYLADSAG